MTIDTQANDAQADNPLADSTPAASVIPTDELAGQALHKFLLLNRHLRKYARQITDQGIRPREFSVLLFLLEKGPSTVGDVQEYLYRSASVASTLVAGLEEAGYVQRARSTQDNRVVIVTLTEVGRQMAETAPMGGIPLLRRQLNTLAPERLDRMDAALTDLMQLMEVVDDE